MPMSTYDASRLIRLFDSRWAYLGDWRNRWEEMSFYIMPQQRSFTSHHNVGNRRQEQLIFDSTALEANERAFTRGTDQPGHVVVHPRVRGQGTQRAGRSP